MPEQIYITLTEAAKLVPGRPSGNCVWRWCRKGLKSRSGEQVRLLHIRIGGRIFTTAKDLDEFFTVLTESDGKHFARPKAASAIGSPSRTDAQKQKAVRLAESELEAAGI